MIFYEAPHRLRETLAELEAAFGPERKVSLCRELTKLHEEILRTTLHGAAAHYAEAEPRGEFVLIVAGSERRAETVTPEAAADLARSLIADGMSKKDAARQVAAETGVSRNMIYNALISGS